MQQIYNQTRLKGYRKSLRKKSTDAEQKLWGALRNKQLNGNKFFRQYSVGNYILDFYCPLKKLGIEVDGGQHLLNEEYDSARSEFLKEYGIKILRFWNNQVLQELDLVLEVIWEELK